MSLVPPPRTESFGPYTNRMTRPIPTRFTDEEIHLIDELVAAGMGENRSDVVRRAVRQLVEERRKIDDAKRIVDSYRARPQSRYDVVSARANAEAMVDAEPW